MKKNLLVLSAMLMCVVSVFTSCVQSDMYEMYDDGTEFFFPRKKGVKDTGGQTPGAVNFYSSVPDYHRIVKAIGGFCNQASLTRKWGSDWHCKIYEVISDIINVYPSGTESYDYLCSKYGYPDNVETTLLNMPSWDVDITKGIMGKMGFSVSQGCVGNFYTIKGVTHTVYIVSQGSGNESNCYVDMDGNVWGPGALELLAP